MKRPSSKAGPERTFERLTLNERLQHGAMVLSFTTLVVTGLPLRFHQSPVAGWLFALMGGPEGRAAIHRGAAIALALLAVYHAGFLFFTERGRYELMAILPRIQDARDAVGHMAYYFGLRKSPPPFGRFSYIEKFEYLALIWGSVVMVVTGLLLWFEVQAMLALPKWVLDICRIVHGYEALLAFLSIIIWHVYCVHFNPDVFPMSRVWLDGRITESDLKHHHPLEYEEIMRAEREAQAKAQGSPAGDGNAAPSEAETEPAVKGGSR